MNFRVGQKVKCICEWDDNKSIVNEIGTVVEVGREHVDVNFGPHAQGWGSRSVYTEKENQNRWSFYIDEWKGKDGRKCLIPYKDTTIFSDEEYEKLLV